MAKRIIVIGAGIIGACIARELALAGADVTIIEAHEPAAGASSRSMGWINASFVEREDYYRLRLAAIAEHRKLDELLGGKLQTRWGGSLTWEAGDEALQALCDEIGRYGHAVRVIDRDDFAMLEPEVADLPPRALLLENEGHIDAGHAVGVILSAARDAGARVVAGCPVSAVTRTAKGWRLTTPLGELEAQDIVIAAGIMTGELAAAAGFSIPMKNEPGILIETNPLPPVLSRTIWSPDVHFKQLPDGRLVCGHQYSGALDEGEDAADAAEAILERVKQRLPRFAGTLRIEKIKHGIRPMPVDSYPAIGRLGSSHDDAYVSVMHSGVTLGPLAGRLVAAELITGEPEPLLAGFRPSRFNRRESGAA